MTFDSARKDTTRKHLWFCEIEVNSETLRFCENISPIPRGLDCVPTLSSQSTTPASIDLTGGIGVRASARVALADHLDYTVYGTRYAPVRFWPNWRARNPGYQGGRLSIYSGYIIDNHYDVANFQRRDYVIETFNYSSGGASFTAKDALKMASGDRAKAPRESIGLLSADILAADTSFTLTPAGVGDIYYPAASTGDPDTHYFVRIGDEVSKVTNRSGDVLTVTRGQYNTESGDHDLNDVVQLCLYFNKNVTDIIYDLLVDYAGVPTSQINKVAWDAESDLYLPGLYEALITEPIGVDSLLKELGESAPHYLYWDERVNLIQFACIKSPPFSSQCFTSEDHILIGSTKITDKTDMRISTVVVKFGQHDPTKELDESSNYRQAHVRITPDSIVRYNGISKYKYIYSRWINNVNRAAAVRLAARYGRRFEDTPRLVTFDLDPSAADIWTGSPITIDSNLILDENGDRFCMPAQIISAGESGTYKYQALEHGYGQPFDSDLDSDDPNQRLVVLSGEILNINLRTIYDTLFADADDTYGIVFVFDSSCTCGSSSTSSPSLNTGLWPELTTSSIKLDVRGIIAGRGGNGQYEDGDNGGPAIILNHDVELINTGIIGGGGGGGGGYNDSEPLYPEWGHGGGGAGLVVSTGGRSRYGVEAQATILIGGKGSLVGGGDGGDLGEPGYPGNNGVGGLAGKAFDLNGFSITYTQAGDIRGVVS